MWTHSKKNLLETQIKRLVGRNGAKIVRTINICSLTKSQFLDLAALLIDTCSGTDKIPLTTERISISYSSAANGLQTGGANNLFAHHACAESTNKVSE